MSTLTKTDVEFDQFVIQRAEEDGETKWYLIVEYRVITAEGETWRKDAQVELKGATKTKAAQLLPEVRAYIKSQEGLS
jgi:hypothetical protein